MRPICGSARTRSPPSWSTPWRRRSHNVVARMNDRRVHRLLGCTTYPGSNANSVSSYETTLAVMSLVPSSRATCLAGLTSMRDSRQYRSRRGWRAEPMSLTSVCGRASFVAAFSCSRLDLNAAARSTRNAASVGVRGACWSPPRSCRVETRRSASRGFSNVCAIVATSGVRRRRCARPGRSAPDPPPRWP